jgi:hypothetical protein
VRTFLVLFAALAIFLLAGRARAETLEAPVGGRPVPLGEGRVACVQTAGGWVAEAGGRAMRPPAGSAAIGSVVELRVAPSPAACAQTPWTVTLVATGPWPSLDTASFVLTLDEGRLQGKGRGLAGSLVVWPVQGSGLAADRCNDPRIEGGVETCTWAVPKSLSADPASGLLQWRPAGSLPDPDAVVFDAEGRKAPPIDLVIVPGRVEIRSVLPADASIDVSSGVGRIPVTHPASVVSVDCGAAHCTLEDGVLVLQAPPAWVSTIDAHFRLAPHVFDTHKGSPDAQPVVRVSVLRCPMTVVSGPVIRGLDSARAVLRLGGGCMRDVGALRFLVGTHQADVPETRTEADAAYAVINVGAIDAPNVSITAVRGEGEVGAAVAVARTETRPAPAVRTVLEIPGFPPLDFIPNNRRAIVHYPHLDEGALALLPAKDVYEATTEGDTTFVRGDVDAVGAVTLQFGYRMPGLPEPLDKVDLAVLPDALHRSVKEANVPAPLGESAFTSEPLVELDCVAADGRTVRAAPGVPLHVPYLNREGCRMILHRERLSPEYGTQKLSLEIQVDKLDGSTRGESRLSQTIILRSGPDPRIAWIKGVVAPFDRAVVRLTHVADEAHYLGALEIPTGAPAVQWAVVFGTGRVRLYATTAIPTGLYRFGTSATSGPLSLSLGILSRFTWLDTEGHEGLLGFEAGLMAFGLTGDTSTTGETLTQVGAVLGVGLSIPIAGAGSATQASINLHAWAEQRITGSGAEEASQRAIIFGPSISLGNIGTTF